MSLAISKIASGGSPSLPWFVPELVAFRRSKLILACRGNAWKISFPFLRVLYYNFSPWVPADGGACGARIAVRLAQ
jgi:hypothetical protein